MRILVHEFASGGGLAGEDVPASLAREGSAMRAALVADLAAIGRHEVVTTADPRFPLSARPGVQVVVLAPGGATLDALIASADAVWLIAPETNGCLERLARRVERNGKALLGPCVSAIRMASDKTTLPRRLARHGIRHPETRILGPGIDPATAAREIGYPVVIKPGRGAGCEGVRLARNVRELRQALADHPPASAKVASLRDATSQHWLVGPPSDGPTRRWKGGATPMVLQQYVPGMAASVSLLADGRRAVPLTLNAQHVRASRRLSYSGGRTPLDHPLARQATEAARRTCQALPGLRGYIGVDIVLTAHEAVVIEVNPRLTTAYLGVRAAVGENVADLALAACRGILPAPPRIRQRVRFSGDGRILSARAYPGGVER